MKYISFAVATLVILAGCSSESSTRVNSSANEQEIATAESNPFSLAPAADPAADQSAEIIDPDNYQGEIGFIVDAREIQRKGHTPRSAQITVNGTLDGGEGLTLTQTIDLGKYSFMGAFSQSVHDLEPDALDTLNDGVEVLVSLYESNQPETDSLILENYKINSVVMQANPKPIVISADTVDEKPVALNLTPTTKYFIEKVNAKGVPVDHGITHQYVSPNGQLFTQEENLPLADLGANLTRRQKFQFRFYPIEGKFNTYAIQYVSTGQFLRIHKDYFTVKTPRHTDTNGGFHNALRLTAQTDFESATNWGGDRVEFRLEKVSDGVYNIYSENTGEPLRILYSWGLTFSDHINYRAYRRCSPPFCLSGARKDWRTVSGYTPGTTEAQSYYVRLVTDEVDWNLESIGAEMVQTIVPSPRVGVAYETDEINCGSQTLTTTTGVERSAETSVSAEFQESFTLVTAQSNTLGWSIGVEVGSPLGGPSYSAEINGSHTWETENSQTQTTTSGSTSTETITFASTKKIDVPTGKRTRVKAGYEIYDDIKAQFVQRFQIRGWDRESGNQLTADEIAAQLQFTSFPGVINGINDDVTEFSIKGEATVSNYIKGQTLITEEDWNCN